MSQTHSTSGQKSASVCGAAAQGKLKGGLKNSRPLRLFCYFFLDDLRLDFLRPPFLPVFFFGTFLPDLRASESPIAMACLRLLTFLPERPLFSVPFLRFFIAPSTFLDAPLEYFLAITFSPGCGRKTIWTV